MGYIMRIFVDGACRDTASQETIGAVASVMVGRRYQEDVITEPLPETPHPSGPRSWLTAIIVALDQALDKAAELQRRPILDVKIFTSSIYAYRNMTEWRARWIKDDYTAANGQLISNRDLLRIAYDKLEDLEEQGTVEFILISPEQENVATRHLIELLDRMAQEQ